MDILEGGGEGECAWEVSVRSYEGDEGIRRCHSLGRRSAQRARPSCLSQVRWLVGLKS